MRRWLALIGLIVVVTACGGSGGSTDASTAPTSSRAPATGGDMPAGSSVLFGSAYDPATLAVTGKSTRIKAGEPVVAVGRALVAVPAADVKIEIAAGGSSRDPRAVDAMDSPDQALYFAVDLSGDKLTPGTWTINFVNGDNRILASGFLTITP